MSAPRNFNFLPAERADASRVSLPTGKFLFSSVLIISMPTAPVAPTTATCGLRFILRRQNIASGGRRGQRGVGAGAASEQGVHLNCSRSKIRIPKPETRRKSEIRGPNQQPHRQSGWSLAQTLFGLRPSFGARISAFAIGRCEL